MNLASFLFDTLFFLKTSKQLFSRLVCLFVLLLMDNDAMVVRTLFKMWGKGVR